MEKTMEVESETREAKFCLYTFYECECRPLLSSCCRANRTGTVDRVLVG